MSNTDKINSGLITFYNVLFKSLKDKPITLLELGVLKGDSILYWSNYFAKGKIIGLDYKLPAIELPQNVEMVKGKQEDTFLLQELVTTKGSFDIVIDDCSHYGEFTQRSFDFLFKGVKSGGYYIIEDWGAGFRCGEYYGLEKIVSKAIENFDRLKLKEVRALKVPQGGWAAIIQKL